MWFSSWLRKQTVSSKRRPTSRYRPRLEALEYRCLMSAGALDSTFNRTGSPPGTVTTSLGAWGNAVALQPDGKIVAEGGIGGGFGVARYNGNGSLDTSFNGTGSATTRIGFSDTPNDVAIQSDGKIVVSGWSAYQYASPRFSLARYMTTGTLDQSFGTHGIVTSISTEFSGHAYAMTIQPDGKIVLAGSGNDNQGYVHEGVGLVRFNSNGSLDNSFGKGGWVFTPYTLVSGGEELTAEDVAIDSAGRLVVVGYASVYGTNRSAFVARYNSGGSLDTSLGGTGIIPLTQFVDSVHGTHVALQTDGKILLTSGLSGTRPSLIRLNADGSLDTTSFGPLNADGTHAGYVTSAAGSLTTDIQLESDGKIVWGGYMWTDQGSGFGVVRLLSDGSLDPSFGSGGISQLEKTVYGNRLAIQPADGNIVVAGQGVIPNSPSGFGVARFVGDTPAPPVAASGFEVSAPANVSAGSSFNLTVIATDASGNLAVSYTGTVSLTSTSSTGVVTALGSYTFTAADSGAHTFSATLTLAGTQPLTATDANGLTGTDPSFFAPGAASRFVFTAYPASVSAATPFSVTITVTDVYGNVVTSYTGTVHFTDSVSGATLPKDYTFTASDQGVHTFTGLILRKKGVHTLKVSDKSNATIFGTTSVDVV